MKKLSVILLACCLCGCKSHKADIMEYENEMTQTLQIDVSQQEMLDIKPFVKSYEYLPLEINQECIIGEVNKIVHTAGRYYILDRRQQKRIYVFDEEGKFLMPIGRRGRGPGEYTHPTDFYVTESAVVVYDMYSHKLNYYDLVGEYIKSETLQYKINEVEYCASDGGLYVVAGDNRDVAEIKDHEILKLSDDKSVSAAYYHNKYSMNYSVEYDLHNCNGEIIYAKPLRSGVFGVDESGCYLKYKFDITPSALPVSIEEVCNGDYARFRDRFADSYAYFNGHYWECDNYVGVGITYCNLPYMSIYDKTTQQVATGIVAASYGQGEDDGMVALPLALNHVVYTEDNAIVGYISHEMIPKNLREKIFGERYDAEFCNPVIVRVELQ